MTKLNMFLTELYKPLLVDQNLQEGNYIKLEKYTTEGLKVQEYHKNINDLINSAKNNSLYYNTFYSLATNNGMSKSNKDSIYKTCLAWDFDKKDYDSLTIKDILHKFREIGLYYNAIVDSGHGYHVYKFIEPTKDIELANKVSKHIAKLVGADENFTGQVLRVPTTHNIKDPKKIKLVNIVFLDTEIKRKNIETLIKAFIQFNSKKREHKLVLVWSNPPKSILNLCQKNIENSDIIFLKYISDKDLVSVYNGATATFFPTRYEGFGFPILESFACNTPVVTCRNTSLPEVGGNIALYTDEDGVDEMSYYMELFENENFDLHLFREQAKNYIKRFSWENTALQYVELYKSLL